MLDDTARARHVKVGNSAGANVEGTGVSGFSDAMFSLMASGRKDVVLLFGRPVSDVSWGMVVVDGGDVKPGVSTFFQCEIESTISHQSVFVESWPESLIGQNLEKSLAVEQCQFVGIPEVPYALFCG